MAYVLGRKAQPAKEIRRVLLEQNAKAQALLDTWQQNPVRNVHHARQSFKRIRAAVWLVRPGHRYVYEVENRSYRDLARQLAYARDSGAMVEAADLLADRIWEPGARQSLLMLRQSLSDRAARETAAAVAGMGDAVRRVRTELPSLAARLERLPLKGLKRGELRRGARRTLGRARRNYERLDAAAGSELFHDWRKHVKYAFYQTALMAELMPRWSRRLRPTLRELAELLGQAQDLHLLDTLIAAQPDELGIDIHWRRLRRLVGRAQGELHAQAAMLGRRIFEQPKPLEADIITLRAQAGGG